uniref:HPt domain-containing protein n=1 Tax=Gossypium raimondii TaxID=29730 RepID=A0A0D2UUX4_GOSRA|nr:hypothetical protein B456_011G182900 [Gossypium raimondii]
MLSFCSFNSFKMRATQILLLKLCLFSLMIQRNFLMISPWLCKKLTFSFLFSAMDVFFSSLNMSFFLYRDQPNVDFKKVDAHVHQLKGSSSRYKALKQYDPTVSLQKLIKLVRSNHSRKTRLQNMKNEQNLGMFKLFD